MFPDAMQPSQQRPKIGASRYAPVAPVNTAPPAPIESMAGATAAATAASSSGSRSGHLSHGSSQSLGSSSFGSGIDNSPLDTSPPPWPADGVVTVPGELGFSSAAATPPVDSTAPIASSRRSEALSSAMSSVSVATTTDVSETGFVAAGVNAFAARPPPVPAAPPPLDKRLSGSFQPTLPHALAPVTSGSGSGVADRSFTPTARMSAALTAAVIAATAAPTAIEPVSAPAPKSSGQSAPAPTATTAPGSASPERLPLSPVRAGQAVAASEFGLNEFTAWKLERIAHRNQIPLPSPLRLLNPPLRTPRP